MAKHLDELVKRQLKKHAKLKEKKRKLNATNNFSSTPLSNEAESADDNEEPVVSDDVEEEPRKSKSSKLQKCAYIDLLFIELKISSKTKSPPKENGQDTEEKASGEECPKLVDTSKLAIVKSLLSTSAFDDLKDKVSDKTLNAVREMNFSHMTEIQSKSIPHLIEGKYVEV